MEYSVLPYLPMPNVWPIKIKSNLIAMEASVLEDGGFKVARFRKSHGVYWGGPIIEHL